MRTVDPLVEKAVREAYASAPVDTVVLDTLEIWHRSFRSTCGPVRILRWPVTGQALQEFQLPLEEDAERNPGETVTFFGVPYEMQIPERSQETPGEFQLQIGGAGSLLEPYLEEAATSGGVLSAIYRSYVQGREADGPRDVWPGIQLHSPYVDQSGNIQLKGSVLNWINRKFGRVYTPGRYPALAGRG